MRNKRHNVCVGYVGNVYDTTVPTGSGDSAEGNDKGELVWHNRMNDVFFSHKMIAKANRMANVRSLNDTSKPCEVRIRFHYV